MAWKSGNSGIIVSIPSENSCVLMQVIHRLRQIPCNFCSEFATTSKHGCWGKSASVYSNVVGKIYTKKQKQFITSISKKKKKSNYP